MMSLAAYLDEEDDVVYVMFMSTYGGYTSPRSPIDAASICDVTSTLRLQWRHCLQWRH